MVTVKLQPKNWQGVRAEDICVKVTDGTHDTPRRLSISNHPLITSKQLTGGVLATTDYFISEEDFKEVNKRSKVDQWDILFGMIGTVGELLIIKDKNPQFAIKNIGLFKTGGNQILTKWLYYYFKSPAGQAYIKSVKRGTSQEYIPLESLREFPILIPNNSEEQQNIIKILSAFDDKIELNNKINQTLEQMAQAIFKEWFSAKEGKFPKGWRVSKIDDLIKIISGHPFSSKLYTINKKALGVVTIRNVQDGNFITNCDSFIDKKNIPENMSPECLIHDGDILLSLTGNVGRVCFVYGGEYLLNQRVAKLQPKEIKDFAFCYFLFRQKKMQNYLINMAKGSAQPNLSPVETGKISLLIPPREILDNFYNLVGSMYKQLVKNAEENQKLASLRDLLLPKLMSGEIRV